MLLVSSANSVPAEVGRNEKIIELRELLAQRFPAAPPPLKQARLVTGIETLDESLDGGLRMGAITEIVCPMESTGSGTIIQALIEGSRAAHRHSALVDGGNSFDPDGVSCADLSALLWIQCDGPEQALKATDILLRDGNLPLVMLDLVMCSECQVRAIPSTSWYRFQRVLEGSASCALVFTPTPVIGSAACTLGLNRRFGLCALDFLRDQCTAGLRVDTLRARSESCFAGRSNRAELAAG